jgi:hypothetical protein
MNTNNNKLQDNKDVDIDLTPDQKAFISEFLALDSHQNLIKKGALTIRMFSMKDKTTIVSLVFKELEDSFITGLPAVIGQIDNKIEARLVSLSSINRMFKNDVTMMAMPLPKFLYFYLIMLKSKVDELPGYLDQERRSQIDILISMLQSMPEINRLSKIGLKNNISVDRDSKPAILKKIEEQIKSISEQVYEEDEKLFTTYRPTTRHRH